MHRIAPLLALVLFFLSLRAGAQKKYLVPQPGESHVLDQAKALGQEVQEELEEQLERFSQRTGRVLKVVVVDSYGRYAGNHPNIWKIAKRIYAAWAEDDPDLARNGGILFISMKEREVSLFLSMALTSAKQQRAQRIVRKSLAEPLTRGEAVEVLLGDTVKQLLDVLWPKKAGWFRSHRGLLQRSTLLALVALYFASLLISRRKGWAYSFTLWTLSLLTMIRRGKRRKVQNIVREAISDSKIDEPEKYR